MTLCKDWPSLWSEHNSLSESWHGAHRTCSVSFIYSALCLVTYLDISVIFQGNMLTSDTHLSSCCPPCHTVHSTLSTPPQVLIPGVTPHKATDLQLTLQIPQQHLPKHHMSQGQLVPITIMKVWGRGAQTYLARQVRQVWHLKTLTLCSTKLSLCAQRQPVSEKHLQRPQDLQARTVVSLNIILTIVQS